MLTQRRARAITADMLPALYDAGEQSVLVDKFDEAAWCFQRALTLEPGSFRARRGLAQIHHLKGEATAARAMISEAMAHGLDPAEGYTMLGQYCQAEGDFPGAIAAFDQAIALEPAHGPARLRRALLRRADAPIADLGALEHASRQPGLDLDQRATLAFALGREYEVVGDHDRAFAAYAVANAVRHAQYPGYADTFASADRMIAVFTPAFLGLRAQFGSQSERPIFVVGMMRSGTSLVEQILASHPAIHGHGELIDIRQISRAIPAELGAGATYPECLPAAPAGLIAGCAERYLRRLERDAPGARRGVDKMPHNFEHLGLIALLFPRAHIIHCARDPLDTCLSNYCQDFGALNPTTYDLAALGRVHREYERLMAHWRAVLPNPILTIPYEGLVEDQEGWSRRAVAFVGLEWSPSCLDFHTNPRSVFTKSLWQVRQPVYRSSIGRWRPYARHLGALYAGLGMAGPPE